MSYQLRRDETPGAAMRRICRRQIELAMAIAAGERESEDTPVHETRKYLKKARAVLSLVRKEIGRGLFQRHDRCLRDVGRLISEIRDAEVRLETVRQLQGIKRRQRRASYRKTEQLLVLELENFMAAFAEWQTQAIPMLENVRSEIDKWEIDQFSYKQLRGRVQSSYKRGRRALAAAKANPSAECFHVFRTEAKQLWYHLRILQPVNPVVLNNLTDELRSLGRLLGRAHDLSFLGERLREERRSSSRDGEANELLAVIEASQSDLQRGAGDLAGRFYAERPRDFGAKVAAWLNDWIEVKTSSVAGALVDDDVDSVASTHA